MSQFTNENKVSIKTDLNTMFDLQKKIVLIFVEQGQEFVRQIKDITKMIYGEDNSPRQLGDVKRSMEYLASMGILFCGTSNGFYSINSEYKI